MHLFRGCFGHFEALIGAFGVMDFINEEKTEIKNTLFIKTKGRIIATHSLLEQYSMFKSTAFFFLES